MHQLQFVNARDYEHYRHKTPRHTIYDDFVQSNTIDDGRKLNTAEQGLYSIEWLLPHKDT